MRKKILFVIITIWIAFIFYNSLQTASESAATSGMFANLINDFFKLIGITIDVSSIIRKLAHVFEFFILSSLLTFLFFEYNMQIKYKVLYTFFISLLVAITDEVIQLFVEGRYGSAIDVLIDSIGIVIGIGIVTLFYYIKYRKKSK